MEHYALYPTESAQGTQTNEDFKPPERLASRDKIRDLQNKAEELIDKARELEEKGEDTKADIARLGAIAAKKKAGLETINQRIKNLKKKL
jgi:peptidoglycan hydrolase CwlO-like protein